MLISADDAVRSRMADPDEPTETRGTEPVETATVAEQAAAIQAARAAGKTPPAGRLLGLPELSDGDVWVDIAGVSAITGLQPRTITGWLSRGQPKSAPFPAAHRFLYRNYWPMSTIMAWLEEHRGQVEAGPSAR